MFTEADVIYTYTRSQALADGVLVDVSATAREAGFRLPVAMTEAAWNDFVAWSDADTKRKGVYQDEAGRLWDVLWMAVLAARRASPTAGQRQFAFLRVPREGRALGAKKVWAKMVCGPGDEGEPVVTIMKTDED